VRNSNPADFVPVEKMGEQSSVLLPNTFKFSLRSYGNELYKYSKLILIIIWTVKRLLDLSQL
jgi:hypothetical protein